MDLEVRLKRERLKVASLTKRIISMGIDDFIVSFIVFLAFIDSFRQVRSYGEMIMFIDSLFIYVFIAYTLYHWIFVALYGKTIGKMITKTKVVDIETLSVPSWSRAFVRSLIRNFDEMFLYFGMMYAIFDPFNRAIYDIAGRCVVVEDN
ncbi:MAG: RDD family protein [Nautiliaceae bacterium]